MAKTNTGMVCANISILLLLSTACEPVALRPARTVPLVELPAVAVVQEQPQPREVVAGETLPMLPTSDEVYPDEPVVAEDSLETEPVDTPAEVAEATNVVHYAELRGRIETHTGKRLTIEPLVITSATLPVPGCMGQLWVDAKSEDGASNWRHFAQIRVATALRFGMSMDVEVVDEDTEFRRENPEIRTLVHGSRVRVEWEW